MTQKDNFIKICDLTTKVMGLEKGALSFKTRVQEVQIPRMVASVIARMEEEIGHTIIADVLKRDRTLIYYYEKTHQANYTWQTYRDTFNKVYMAYKKIDDEKEVFIDKNHMRKYLLSNGVRENEKQEAKIMVKSGKVGVVINTSYFDFSNQLENIKLALSNYKYQVEIL
tara:strand:+ start:82 stop:588 length:507 start_codon:yes stop_codon:yes gene_type:complete